MRASGASRVELLGRTAGEEERRAPLAPKVASQHLSFDFVKTCSARRTQATWCSAWFAHTTGALHGVRTGAKFNWRVTLAFLIELCVGTGWLRPGEQRRRRP